MAEADQKVPAVPYDASYKQDPANMDECVASCGLFGL